MFWAFTLFVIVMRLLLISALIATNLLANEKDWAVSTTLGNSVGIGTFVTGYSQVPSWSTSLSFSPSYKLPAFWGMPRITLSAFESISAWWIESYYSNASNFQNRVQFSDLYLNAGVDKLVSSENTGLQLGANTGIMLPLSLFSRNMKRIMAFSVGLPMAWSKYGVNIGYTPSVSGWVFSSPNITAPCYSMTAAIIDPYSPNSDINQAIQGLSIARSNDEVDGDGQCIITGRQNTWTLSNAFSAGWSNKHHNVSLGFSWYFNFLRALSDRPELNSSLSSAQTFFETTMGRLAYSYTLPIETNLSFSAGILSWQSSIDSQGRLTFPFFDFVTPGRNQTQIFVQATVGI